MYNLAARLRAKACSTLDKGRTCVVCLRQRISIVFPMDAVLYFVFHFVYLGNPTYLLAQLWLAYEHEHGLYPEVVEAPWRTLSERMMESYRAIGVMGGLIASAAGALLSFSGAEKGAAQTLLFASLSASILAVSTSTSFLSTASYFDPGQLEQMWSTYGMKFVILLSTPSSWLDIAVYALEAALLALVWSGDLLGGRVVVTTFVGFATIVHVWLRVAADDTWTETLCGFFGNAKGINYRTISPSERSLDIRQRYRECGGVAKDGSISDTRDILVSQGMRILSGGRGRTRASTDSEQE